MRIPRRYRPPLALAGLALAAGLAVFGCDPSVVRGSKAPAMPTAFAQSTELKPETLPYDEGFLVLAGTQIPVVMEHEKTANKVTFKIKANGALIEEEVYEFDNSGFRFAAGPGVAIEPAIPLIRYPVKSGEKWNWAGKLKQADVSYEATAEITAKNETLNIPAGQFETLYVEVNMRLNVGTPEPAIRLLKFWFVPNQGIIRREFGASSTREPRAADPANE